MPIYGKHPFIEEGTYVAPNASVIGDVDVGEKSSVWYGAVLRGDINSIKIGDFTSIGTFPLQFSIIIPTLTN